MFFQIHCWNAGIPTGPFYVISLKDEQIVDNYNLHIETLGTAFLLPVQNILLWLLEVLLGHLYCENEYVEDIMTQIFQTKLKKYI